MRGFKSPRARQPSSSAGFGYFPCAKTNGVDPLVVTGYDHDLQKRATYLFFSCFGFATRGLLGPQDAMPELDYIYRILMRLHRRLGRRSAESSRGNENLLSIIFCYGWRSRYPTPRTLSIISAQPPSFLRNVRTTASTTLLPPWYS